MVLLLYQQPQRKVSLNLLLEDDPKCLKVSSADTCDMNDEMKNRGDTTSFISYVSVDDTLRHFESSTKRLTRLSSVKYSFLKKQRYRSKSHGTASMHLNSSKACVYLPITKVYRRSAPRTAKTKIRHGIRQSLGSTIRGNYNDSTETPGFMAYIEERLDWITSSPMYVAGGMHGDSGNCTLSSAAQQQHSRFS